jgi:N-acetylglutamate synthase-like GNAT family acetyltransferase
MNIVLDKTPSKEDVNQLNQRLLEYNQSKVPNYSYDDFIFKLEDETKHMLAGIHCIVGSGWLYIAGLWVKDSLRKEGFGKKLVDMAENEAKKRGCIGIYLFTYSFQSPEFYEKLGFNEFGSLNNYAKNHSKIYMAKLLV